MRRLMAAAVLALSALAARPAGAVIIDNINPTLGDLTTQTLVSGDDLRNNGPFSSNGQDPVAYLLNEGLNADGDLTYLLHYDRNGGLRATGRVSGSFQFQLSDSEALLNVFSSSLDLRNSDDLTNGVIYQRCLLCTSVGATVLRGIEPSLVPIFGDIVTVTQLSTQAVIYQVTYDLSNDGSTLDEVRFVFDQDVQSGTPEPESWALMISGFGLAGAALRRRRTYSVA